MDQWSSQLPPVPSTYSLTGIFPSQFLTHLILSWYLLLRGLGLKPSPVNQFNNLISIFIILHLSSIWHWWPHSPSWNSILPWLSQGYISWFFLGSLIASPPNPCFCSSLIGRQIPRFSHVSACLASRGTDCLYSKLSFKEYLYSERPWRIQKVSRSSVLIVQYNNVSLWNKGQPCLLSIIKDSDSLSLGFLSCNATHCIFRWHLDIFALLHGNWGSKNQHKKMLMLWLLLLLS